MEFKQGSITVIDDIFSTEECKEMISYYNDNDDKLIHRQDYRNLLFLPIVDNLTQLPMDEYSQKISTKIMKWMEFRYRIQRAHIERRHPGSYMNYHLDSAFDKTMFTSVTYLNEGYGGGHTIIRPHGDDTDKHNIEIIPRVGRTVFFHGAYHNHCVTEINESNRFTMPIWYMAMPRDLPPKHKWWLE